MSICVAIRELLGESDLRIPTANASKRAVTVVGTANKEELVWMLGELMNALKHDTDRG
jgi:Holliday junction resolvasome RuvABC endonuclease subunit